MAKADGDGARSPAGARAIERRPIGAPIPYARNARTHSEAQVALIAGSIREFGFNNPVLVDGATASSRGMAGCWRRGKLGLAAGAGDRTGASERGAEAGLHPCRQPAGRAGGMGPELLGAGAGRSVRAGYRPRRRSALNGAELDALLDHGAADPKEEATPEVPGCRSRVRAICGGSGITG